MPDLHIVAKKNGVVSARDMPVIFAIHQELERKHAEVTPKVLVTYYLRHERSKPRSVLGKYFTKDKNKGYAKCLVSEAQAILQSICLFASGLPTTESVAYSVYLPATAKQPAIRTTMPRVLTNRQLMLRYISEARQELQRWVRRYEHTTNFCARFRRMHGRINIIVNGHRTQG